jgi:excisionase family DNA binding protein
MHPDLADPSELSEDAQDLQDLQDLVVYTIPEVARILKVGRHNVEALIRSKQLKAKLVGNRYRITQRNLIAYLNDDEPSGAETAGMSHQKKRLLRLHG